MSAQNDRAPRVTVSAFAAMKDARRPIVMLTAYDFHSARLAEAAGVDAILVGDSLGMTVLGHPSTLPVTMDDMVRATAAVTRACERVLVVADMPFGSWQASVDDAVRNAVRLVAEGGAHAVKLEGADAHTLEAIERIVDAGIPVMGHIGLTPQSVNALGGYKTQGKDTESAMLVIDSAERLEGSGVFSVVLECIPVELAEYLSGEFAFATIGIGAGTACDGQVQVYHDVLGLGDFTPKHAKRYAQLDAEITRAVTAYADDVRAAAFPAEENTTHAEKDLVHDALELHDMLLDALEES